MTRNELIEIMARAAWESPAQDPHESWNDLPASIRWEWIAYQSAALEALEHEVPAVRNAMLEFSSNST
jgi:hypothetical protein